MSPARRDEKQGAVPRRAETSPREGSAGPRRGDRGGRGRRPGAQGSRLAGRARGAWLPGLSGGGRGGSRFSAHRVAASYGAGGAAPQSTPGDGCAQAPLTPGPAGGALSTSRASVPAQRALPLSFRNPNPPYGPDSEQQAHVPFSRFLDSRN